uniref:Protein-serine/threonine kinase n=1 Tax=Pavo cristatus TaxID=9049 RepID=A0A8C9FXE9_PAVCR
MKAARIALRTAVPLAGAGSVRSSRLPREVEEFSRFSPSPLSIKQLLDFGESPGAGGRPRAGVGGRREVGCAATLFGGVNGVEEAVVNRLMDVFAFIDTLIRVRNRHHDVVPTMAQGVIEYKDMFKVDPVTNQNIQYFLDRFYMSRISTRMLMNQHTLLFDDKSRSGHPRHIGSIDPCCDVVEVVNDAFQSSKMLCDQYYLTSPELKLNQVNGKLPGEPINIVYVPSHLFHMLFELFKVRQCMLFLPSAVSRKIFGHFHMVALSTESVEKLPVFNKSASKHYQATSEADDWCIPSKGPKQTAEVTS